MRKTLIKNANIINAESPAIQGSFDILIEDGIISDISKNINKDSLADAFIIDANGLDTMPAFVDMHVHLREPGYEYKEDIASGAAAAVHGGFAAIVCMPNTSPTTDDPSVVEYVKNRAKIANLCHVYPAASITKSLNGEVLSEMGLLLESGAIAFTDDGKPVSNGRLMKLAMQYSTNFDALIMSHAEDTSLSKGGVMHEGDVSYRIGLSGIPSVAEEGMIARDIMLAESYGARIHFCHVSTKRGLDIIRSAKLRGVKVTCETAPHYFSANHTMVEQSQYSTNTKMNPPLRSESDQKAVIEALSDGTIDAIATDHAPHHADEKNVEFDLAAFGIIGLETSYSLGNILVKAGSISKQKLVSLMSTNPAKILGLDMGEIAIGKPAHITIADSNADCIYTEQNIRSKSKNTPFLNTPLSGKILYTIVDGDIKYSDSEV